MVRYLKSIFCAFTLVLLICSFPIVSGAAEYKEEIRAEDIVKQIENGEDVVYNNSFIKGTLDLSGANLKTVSSSRGDLKVIESEIKIENSIFEGDVDFSNSEFEEPVTFVDTNFSGSNSFYNADFSNSRFKKSVDFSSVNFSGNSSFYQSTFFDSVNFYGSNFYDNVVFCDAVFHSYAEFFFTTFNGYVNFQNASFNGDSTFFGSYFFGSVIFKDVKFRGNAHLTYLIFNNSKLEDTKFENIIFNKNANFKNTTFLENTKFKNIIFNKNVDFKNTMFHNNVTFVSSNFEGSDNYFDSTFHKNVEFSNCTFVGKTDFQHTKFNNETTFVDVTFNDVDFYDTTFTTVSLNNFEFREMEANWTSLENSLVFNGPIYVKLIRNFRNLEQFDDADAAYFHYRKHRQEEKPFFSSSKWMDMFMELTCGYGVKPFRAFFLGGSIVLIFSFFYRGWPTLSFSGEEKIDRIYRLLPEGLRRFIPKIDWPNPGISRLTTDGNCIQKISFWDAFYFSMGIFATVGYGDLYPRDKFRKLVMIEGFLGWLTLGLFLVTLANVMIRP